MAQLPTPDWWIRRMWRWIDVARREVRRGEGRRYRAPTAREFVAARIAELQSKKRDLLILDPRRRRPR